MKRRLLSLLVCLCMALTLLPTTAWAMHSMFVNAQPSQDNDYTFEVEYSDESATVSYQWYLRNDARSTFVVIAEEPGENEIRCTATYSSGGCVDGLWSSTSDSSPQLDIEFPASADDTIRVRVISGTDVTVTDGSGNSYQNEEAGLYSFTVPERKNPSNLMVYSSETFTAIVTLETYGQSLLAGETSASLQTRDAGEYFCVATAEKDGEFQASETSDTVTVEAPVARLDWTEGGAAKTADLTEREVRSGGVSDYLRNAEESAGATLTLLADSAATLVFEPTCSFNFPATLTSGEGGPYTLSRDMADNGHSKRGNLLTAYGDCTVTNLTLDGTVPPEPPVNTESPSFVTLGNYRTLTLGEGATIQNGQPVGHGSSKTDLSPALPPAAVDAWGSLTMTDGSAIVNNQGGEYGGVAVRGTVTLSGAVTIKGNQAVDLTGIYSFDDLPNATKVPGNLVVFAPDPSPRASAAAPIQVVGSLAGSEIGVTLLDYYMEKPTSGKVAAGSDYTLTDADLAAFFSDRAGYFPSLNSEENAIYLEQYAITQQPTADNGYTVTANGRPTFYQWYPATVVTEAVTDQNTVEGPYPCTYADGKWTAGMEGGDEGYFTLALKKGDMVTVTVAEGETIPTGDSFCLYDFTSDEMDTVACQADKRVYTLTAPADGTYTLETFMGIVVPVISATVSKVNLDKAVSGQTTDTLAAPAAGDYLCQVTYPDGTVLQSNLISVDATPHDHAVSVNCETTGPGVTHFTNALTVNGEGKLCVNGEALTPDASGGYTLADGNNYYLAEDIALGDAIHIQDNEFSVILCLNGHTLDLGNKHITVEESGYLRLCDCGKAGAVTTAYASGLTSTAAIMVSGRFNLYGGTVENTDQGTSGTWRSGVSVAGGPVNLYGGTVTSAHGNGLWVNAWQAKGLNLSGDVTIQGGADQAEVYLDYPNPTWENNAHFTLTGTLAKPDAPWRVAVEGQKPLPLVTGWSDYMDGQDFGDYFRPADGQSLFVEQREDGDLAMAQCAITQQPSAVNGCTVAANGAPASVPTYQWYPAKVVTKDITPDNATACTSGSNTATYDPATKLWTGVGSSYTDYFTIHLLKGDKVTVKPDASLGEYTRVYLKPVPYEYSYMDSLFGSEANEAGEYVLTAKVESDYTFEYTSDQVRSIGSDSAPAFTATVTCAELGQALTGQDTATLTSATPGESYLCRVTWPNGTALNSDIVAYTPPHVHDWGKWILQSDSKTLKRVCAGDDSHTESAELSCGLPTAAIVYDGTEKKPAPSLKADGDIGALTQGADYTVAYKNNVNAGTGSVTITGKGDFDFTLEKTFTIQKADQAAPAGIFHITDAAYNETTGSIAITTDASTLEYRVKPTDGSDPAWTQAASSNTLPAGTYEFRYKATGNYNASPATQVQVRVESPNAKALTIDQGIEHGAVEKRRDKVNPGDTVTLSVKPEAGYELSSLTVTYGDGKTITPTVSPDNAQLYTFTMPDADVTVTATFTALPPDDGDAKGEVEVKPGTPEVSVDKETLKDLAGEVQPGETVTVKLTVEAKDDPADKGALESVITEDKVLYLDLSLLRQVNDGHPETISDTGDKVLEIAVDYDFTGKRDVTVYRKHGESDPETLTKLAARPTEDFADGSFYADSEGGVVYIYASKFSTYAIGYTETTTPNRPSRPSGGRPGTVGTTGTTAPAWPFVDVKTTDAFYDAVKYVYEKGWMVGTSDTTFTPGGELTRAMLATVLYRMAGSPKVEGAPEFEDTKADAWYSDAVVWASQTQVLRGYGNGKFGPEDPVSREMLNMVAARQQGQDPVWVGDPELALPATRAEIATVLMEQDKK